MMASAIAYGTSAFLAFLACGGVIAFFQKTDAETTLIRFCLTLVIAAAAWGCAYLGGI